MHGQGDVHPRGPRQGRHEDGKGHRALWTGMQGREGCLLPEKVVPATITSQGQVLPLRGIQVQGDGEGMGDLPGGRNQFRHQQSSHLGS